MATEQKKRLLLIDYRNLLCRSLFANRSLAWNGVPTGGIYGFLNTLCSLTVKHQIDRVIVCMDSKPYHRMQDYTEYKLDRAPMEKEDARAIAEADAQVQKLIAHLKMVVVKERGWEADDIIGQYCAIRYRRYPQIYVCSTDTDLYQLLGSQGAVYLCLSKGLYGLDNFKEEFPDLRPWQWSHMSALKGSHNGVPGIKGVGPKTAYKLVSEKIPLKEVAQKYGVSFKGLKKKIELSTYPYPAILPGPTLANDHPITYVRAAAVRFLAPYGINLTSQMDMALDLLSAP